MMKTRSFFKALKIVVINSLIFSLLQNPFISNALAADGDSSGMTSQDIQKITNGIVNLYGNYLGQKSQMIQAQIASAQNQKMMAQLSPSCRKPDGSACYVSQAKYFPECQLPASMSNMPANACASGAADPNAISTMLTYESIAQGWMNYYDQMANEASNAAYPVGLRCLQDKQKAMDSQLTEMMNSLQRLQDRLNQDKQIFRDNNKKLLDEMNTANDELFGASKNNLALKTRDFSKYFSQSCQSVIGKDALMNGTKIGLNGILQNLSGPSKSAADFSLNKSAIENDIRREADKIATTIRTGGVDDFLQKGYIPQSNEAATTFAAIGTQIKKQNAELEVAKARIKKALDEVNYPMPTMGSNFSADMQDFMAGANDYFKKKYINDCVTGADKGIAIPVEDILASLEQKSTNSEGTARNDYREALRKILESDAMIADKMEKIKLLDKDYPGMTITYKDATQNRVTESPYNLFMKTIDKCEQRYVQDDTFANKNERSVSYQKKVERAREALAELKTLNDSYASKVSGAVLSQVLDCGGSSLKSGSCNEDTLNSKGENFCIAQASQCANEIQGCYAEANNQVQVRKAKMENLAKKFNENVTQMIARSNALYEQQKAAVTNMTKLIQARFPGTNFEIPKDMFVSMPEMKKDTYGVEMAGDGKLESFLDSPNSMPEKISLLKEMFKKQKTEVDRSLAEYIDLQKSAMEREKGRWQSLKEKCTSVADAAIKGVQMANQEGMKKQAELDNLVAKYCDKYTNLKPNSNGACDQAKSLTETMEKILEKGGKGRINGNVGKFAAEYSSSCKATGNETELGDVCSDADLLKKSATIRNKCFKDDKKTENTRKNKIPLIQLCPSEKTDDKDFFEAAKKRLTSDDQGVLKDASTMDDVVKVVGNVSSDAAAFFENVRNLSSGTSICKQLIEVSKSEDAVVEKDNKKEQKASPKKAQLEEALTKLANATVPVGDDRTLSLVSLGEKPDDPCDALNSSGMPKSTLPWMMDPSAIDSKILGRSK